MWPNRPLFLGVALALSLFFGGFIAFLRDQVRPSFFDVRALRHATAKPILGSVSMVRTASALARLRLNVALFFGSLLSYVGSFSAVVAFLAYRTLAK